MYTTTYDYDTSGRLIHEICVEANTYTGGSTSTRDITYLYDESGIIGAIQKRGTVEETFYFDRNIKGDVVGIFNSSGSRVASYIYDAWGNCTTKTHVSNSFSAYNPIRYRGYYYDRETKLYYLNSRYYNPEWRRFISPDDTAYLDPDTPNGLNLYAYCNNDPVNYSDPSGKSIIGVLAGAFVWGAFVGAVVSVGTQLIENEFDWQGINPWVVLNDAIFGGLSGMLAVSGLHAFWMAPLNAWLNTMQILINARITGEELNPNEILFTGILTYAISFIPLPSVSAKRVSETYKLTKYRLSSKSKMEFFVGMVKFFKYPAIVASIYAISTPVFSLATSFGAEYIEEFLYGTGKYDIP